MVKYRTLEDGHTDNSRVSDEFANARINEISLEGQIAQYEALRDATERPDEQQAYSSTLESVSQELEATRKQVKALEASGVEPAENLNERVADTVRGNLHSYERQHAALVPYLKFLEDSEQEYRLESERAHLAGLEGIIAYYQAKMDEVTPPKQAKKQEAAKS
jgi:hypothetical protein